MERRKAMAVAAVGAMLSASAVIAAGAGVLGDADGEALDATSTTVTTPPVETTTSLAPVVLTEVRDVYDTVVVPTAPPAPAPAPEVAAAPPPPGPEPDRGADDEPAAKAAPPAEDPTTSTTRPPGVPDDWPEDKPIPPMPEGCEKPQLEDDGQWNCDH